MPRHRRAQEPPGRPRPLAPRVVVRGVVVGVGRGPGGGVGGVSGGHESGRGGGAGETEHFADAAPVLSYVEGVEGKEERRRGE